MDSAHSPAFAPTPPLGSGAKSETGSEITRWLRRWSEGDQQALAPALPAIYGELRRLAARALSGERPGHTLQPTALVHEAYLRLAALRRVRWRDRAHFYGAAARTMRRVLVDHARRRAALKRAGAPPPDRLPGGAAARLAVVSPATLLTVDRALGRLARREPEAAAVVELRLFAGMTLAETAAALDCSEATVSRRWTLARAWLYREVTRR